MKTYRIDFDLDELEALRWLVQREAERLRSRAADMFPYGSQTSDRSTDRAAKKIARVSNLAWKERMKLWSTARKKRGRKRAGKK